MLTLVGDPKHESLQNVKQHNLMRIRRLMRTLENKMGTLLDIAKNTLNGTYYGSLNDNNINKINKIQNDHPFFPHGASEPHDCALSVLCALSFPGEHPNPFWRNPYPQGYREARAESLRVIEAARRGEQKK